MNVKQREASKRRIVKQNLDLRDQLWPNLDRNELWETGRDEKKGWVKLPRALPVIFRILDELSDKGKPVSSTFLALWCRNMGDHLISIPEPKVLAYESGFGGPRSESTWRSRMKKLCELGFIEAKPGTGSYSYVLLLNPYRVIKNLRDHGKIKEMDFINLFKRAQEIRADEDLK